NLIRPQPPLPVEEDRQAGERVAFHRPERELVLPPIAGNIFDLGLGVDFAAGHIGFERDRHASVELFGLQPQVTAILDAIFAGRAALVNAVTRDDARAELRAQRVAARHALGFSRVRISRRLVPADTHAL